MSRWDVLVVEEVEQDRFSIRFPGPHEDLLKLIRTLVPAADRNVHLGKGWDVDNMCWTFALDYMNDVLLAVEKTCPNWGIKLVEELPPVPERKK